MQSQTGARQHLCQTVVTIPVPFFFSQCVLLRIILCCGGAADLDSSQVLDRRPFSNSWKLFTTSLPFDRQQSTKGLVAPNLFPSQYLWKLLLGIISKGVEARALLLCLKKETSKQFSCPHCEEEGSQGKFPIMEKKKRTQALCCILKHLHHSDNCD